MRLLRLHLKAFGPFTDRMLDFGDEGRGLVLVHGENEAGKSSALRAMTDLRFGIPQQSADNFIHPHPEMRVGGELLDRQGRRHALIRRKGRQNTLSLTDFSDPMAPALGPASAEIETLLTAGLDREAYETGFGIDHRRLREGGRALVEGRGEIGSALFEASAGLRGIAAVLGELDQSARRHFVPGARGSRGRINEALRQLDESHARLRQSLVRPAHWADLSRRHRAAAEALEALEGSQRAQQARARELAELRAVAPLLAAHDRAAAALAELRDIPLLPEDGERRRAAAESGLAAAIDDIARAEAEIARHRHALERLRADPEMMALASAARRLIASAEAIDRHREAAAEAEIALASAHREAARIELALASRPPDAGAGASATGGFDADAALTPSASQRAAIDEALLACERSMQALAQHREAIADASVAEAEDPLPELPEATLRARLRTARAKVTRHDDLFERMTALPDDIAAARRAFDQALADTGLPDEAAMHRVRPLLDARIDEAANTRLRDATRREEFRQRLAEIEAAHTAEHGKRETLLAAGEVPTRSQLEAARAARDAGWRQLRQRHLTPGAGARASADPDDSAVALADAHEAGLALADRIADALAADHERAVRLQALDDAIASLERDARHLRDEISRSEAGSAAGDTEWQALLAEAGLPLLPPDALRDWQTRFAALRAAASRWQEACAAFERASRTAAELGAALRDAIAAIASPDAMPAPPPDSDLDTLCAIADGLEETLRQRERQLDTADGRRRQRRLEAERLSARDAMLAAALDTHRLALQPALEKLGLAPEASPAVVRARLAELDALADARLRRDRALAAQGRAQQSLALLSQAAAALAAELGEPPPADLRLFLERLSLRLDAAEASAREEALTRQALSNAQQELARDQASAARHRQTLADLCAAAGIDHPSRLPEVESASRRKRTAQEALEGAAEQLVQASRQPVDVLRAQLAEMNAERLEADDAACAQQLAELESQIREARELEEQARLALRAIDASDAAAAERERVEQLAARLRSELPAWMQARLAHALLGEAMRRFRERAQGPMLRQASALFATMTGNAFVRLVTDDDGERAPVLLAERAGGRRVHVDGLSEGTADQLYIALRLAALHLRREAGIDLPVVLDDVLMTSDDERAARMLASLADFSEDAQVIVFTHHRHLVDLARKRLSGRRLEIVDLADCR